MSYLRILYKGQGRYYYIVKSERHGAKVRARVLEYLGRDPDPKRLRKAITYWGVKAKPGKGGR